LAAKPIYSVLWNTVSFRIGRDAEGARVLEAEAG